MASYTMQLKEYLEMWSQDNPDMKTRDVIEVGRPKLFDFDYPLFDPNYKKVFETHFIRNFYTTEIGFETEELFKFKLETWLIINMPYFNNLFKSELIEYDPLINSKVDVTANKENNKERSDIRDILQDTKEDGTSDSTTHQTGSVDSNSTSTGSVDSNSTSSLDGSIVDDDFNRKIDSDNPDSRLNLTSNDGEGVIEYASSIEENNANNKRTTSQDGTGTEHSDSESSGTEHSDSLSDGTTHQTTSETGNLTKNDTLESSIDETEDYIQHRVGKIGVVSYPKLVTDYRNAFLRIEKTIFQEMQQLFMLVY